MVAVTLFTDPACPFAFSAEPVRVRLRWTYGDQLTWRTRMIVLTREDGEAEKLAGGAPGLQARHGMPIHPAPYGRPASSEPACRAVVAAQLHAPEQADRLLRRLRVGVMRGGLIDDPAVLAAAAHEAGLDLARLQEWSDEDAVRAALEADIAAARDPSPAARALDHKLSGPRRERRYSAPSYELANPDTGFTVAVPGFNPIEAYDVAIAALDPQLRRRPAPTVSELLAWAGEPLATAEVVAVTGLSRQDAVAELGRVARPLAAGADFYWLP